MGYTPRCRMCSLYRAECSSIAGEAGPLTNVPIIQDIMKTGIFS